MNNEGDGEYIYMKLVLLNYIYIERFVQLINYR